MAKKRTTPWATAERRRLSDRRAHLAALKRQDESMSQVDLLLQQHEAALAMSFRRIADLQVDIDRLHKLVGTFQGRRRAGKKR